MITSEQLEQLKEYLQGSCLTIGEAMNDLFELSEDDLSDEQIEDLWTDNFKCSNCGWWFEMGEESGIDESELICNDCADDC
jgi:hypothetical protein